MEYKNIEYKSIYTIKNEFNEAKILGANNTNLKVIEDMYDFPIIVSKSTVSIPSNKDEREIVLLFETLEKLLNASFSLSLIDIINIIQSIKNNTIEELQKIYLKKELICTLFNSKAIYPKTINQSLYLHALINNEIVFGVGPAGTGKTFIAVLYACNLLKHQKIKKIVLVRPVVEAGEKLGFLPGDIKEKIDPYLIPLYDCLEDCFGKENVEKMIEKGVIEIAPLAYMRGRTLDNACIILDEAQNTTLMQMKMFLTRLGFNSKMIITGDMSQIDLVNKNQSGLIEANQILKEVYGIKFIYFEKSDVMRNPLVYKIIEKYEAK
ncbi:MAG: PhoH family protein [Bacilli bacterium]|nr:PhoH family protein [Bacilli bacterium]